VELEVARLAHAGCGNDAGERRSIDRSDIDVLRRPIRLGNAVEPTAPGPVARGNHALVEVNGTMATIRP
jgi:hypothetical protein